LGPFQRQEKGIQMKTIKFSLILLIILIFTACSSNNLPTNISNSNIENNKSGNTTSSSESDSHPISVTINTLDISKFEGTIPTDLEEMLVYGDMRLNDQIIYLSDISKFGMDDDEINDYGLWHDSTSRVFCGF
jgi:hypothetical protein